MTDSGKFKAELNLWIPKGSELTIFNQLRGNSGSSDVLQVDLAGILSVHDNKRMVSRSEYKARDEHPAWRGYLSAAYPDSYAPPDPLPYFSNYPHMVKRAGLVKM